MEYKNTFDEFDLDIQKTTVGYESIGPAMGSFPIDCMATLGSCLCGGSPSQFCNFSNTPDCNPQSAHGGCTTVMGPSCNQCGATVLAHLCRPL